MPQREAGVCSVLLRAMQRQTPSNSPVPRHVQNGPVPANAGAPATGMRKRWRKTEQAGVQPAIIDARASVSADSLPKPRAIRRASEPVTGIARNDAGNRLTRSARRMLRERKDWLA